MRLCLSALCGIPGSGKTSFCKKMLEFSKISRLAFGVIWLCYDNLLVKTDFNSLEALEQKHYKTTRSELLTTIENLVETLKEKNYGKSNLISEDNSHLKQEILILLDDNMFYKSMRYKILQIARKFETGYFEIYFECDLQTAVIRNSNRSQMIPQQIIEKMYYQLEKPTNTSKTLVINVNDNDFNNLESLSMMFSRAIETPETMKIQSNVEIENHQCELHQIDLILRKEISKIMKETPETSEELKLLAKILNDKRKQILIDLRTKIIEVPTDLSHIVNYLS